MPGIGGLSQQGPLVGSPWAGQGNVVAPQHQLNGYELNMKLPQEGMLQGWENAQAWQGQLGPNLMPMDGGPEVENTQSMGGSQNMQNMGGSPNMSGQNMQHMGGPNMQNMGDPSMQSMRCQENQNQNHVMHDFSYLRGAPLGPEMPRGNGPQHMQDFSHLQSGNVQNMQNMAAHKPIFDHVEAHRRMVNQMPIRRNPPNPQASPMQMQAHVPQLPLNHMQDHQMGNMQSQQMGNTQSQPMNNMQSQPMGNMQNQPMHNMQSQPMNSMQNQPMSNMQNQSMNNMQSQPMNSMQNQPMSNMHSQQLHNMHGQQMQDQQMQSPQMQFIALPVGAAPPEGAIPMGMAPAGGLPEQVSRGPMLPMGGLPMSPSDIPMLNMIAVPMGEAPPDGAMPVPQGSLPITAQMSSLSEPSETPRKTSKAFKIVDPRTNRQVLPSGEEAAAATSSRRLRIVNPKTGKELRL